MFFELGLSCTNIAMFDSLNFYELCQSYSNGVRLLRVIKGY